MWETGEGPRADAIAAGCAALKGKPEKVQEQQHLNRTGKGGVCAIAQEGTIAAKDSAQFAGRWTFENADKFRKDIWTYKTGYKKAREFNQLLCELWWLVHKLDLS